MEILKLHADGADAHFTALKEKFNKLCEKINTDVQLSDIEKTSRLKDVRASFSTEKKVLKYKIF